METLERYIMEKLGGTNGQDNKESSSPQTDDIIGDIHQLGVGSDLLERDNVLK